MRGGRAEINVRLEAKWGMFPSSGGCSLICFPPGGALAQNPLSITVAYISPVSQKKKKEKNKPRRHTAKFPPYVLSPDGTERQNMSFTLFSRG